MSCVYGCLRSLVVRFNCTGIWTWRYLLSALVCLSVLGKATTHASIRVCIHVHLQSRQLFASTPFFFFECMHCRRWDCEHSSQVWNSCADITIRNWVLFSPTGIYLVCDTILLDARADNFLSICGLLRTHCLRSTLASEAIVIPIRNTYAYIQFICRMHERKTQSEK